MADIVERHGDRAEPILRRYGLYSAACHHFASESLGQEARCHGVEEVQITHLVRELNEVFELRWVCLPRRSDPFRTVEDIEAAVALALQGDCDSVISVVQVFSVHPILMKHIERGRLMSYCIDEKEGTRRQDYQPPAYMRNGAIYLTSRDVLMERNSVRGEIIGPYIMPEKWSVGVDSELLTLA